MTRSQNQGAECRTYHIDGGKRLLSKSLEDQRFRLSEALERTVLIFSIFKTRMLRLAF